MRNVGFLARNFYKKWLRYKIGSKNYYLSRARTDGTIEFTDEADETHVQGLNFDEVAKKAKRLPATEPKYNIKQVLHNTVNNKYYNVTDVLTPVKFSVMEKSFAGKNWNELDRYTFVVDSHLDTFVVVPNEVIKSLDDKMAIEQKIAHEKEKLDAINKKIEKLVAKKDAITIPTASTPATPAKTKFQKGDIIAYHKDLPNPYIERIIAVSGNTVTAEGMARFDKHYIMHKRDEIRHATEAEKKFFNSKFKMRDYVQVISADGYQDFLGKRFRIKNITVGGDGNLRYQLNIDSSLSETLKWHEHELRLIPLPQPGDKVRIISTPPKDTGSGIPSWDEKTMNATCGKTGEVTAIDANAVHVEFEGGDKHGGHWYIQEWIA